MICPVIEGSLGHTVEWKKSVLVYEIWCYLYKEKRATMKQLTKLYGYTIQLLEWLWNNPTWKCTKEMVSTNSYASDPLRQIKHIKRGQSDEKRIRKISLGEIPRGGENPCYFLLWSNERGPSRKPGAWSLTLRTGYRMGGVWVPPRKSKRVDNGWLSAEGEPESATMLRKAPTVSRRDKGWMRASWGQGSHGGQRTFEVLPKGTHPLGWGSQLQETMLNGLLRTTVGASSPGEKTHPMPQKGSNPRAGNVWTKVRSFLRAAVTKCHRPTKSWVKQWVGSDREWRELRSWFQKP